MTEQAKAATAINQLITSDRGSLALVGLAKWLDEYGSGLDAQNQEAVLSLLLAAWGPMRGTVRQMIRDAIE